MSVQEIKSEIRNSLDSVPDGVLAEILNVIRQSKEDVPSEEAILRDLEVIMAEDNEVFEKLAK